MFHYYEYYKGKHNIIPSFFNWDKSYRNYIHFWIMLWTELSWAVAFIYLFLPLFSTINGISRTLCCAQSFKINIASYWTGNRGQSVNAIE